MRQSWLIWVFILFTAVPFLTSHAQSSSVGNNEEPIIAEGQLYIKFKTDFAAAAGLQRLKQNSATRTLFNQIRVQQFDDIFSPRLKSAIRHYRQVNDNAVFNRKSHQLDRIYHMNFSGEFSTPLLAAKIERHPDVAYAVPRYYHHLAEVPNDPQQGEYLDFHRFYDAWDTSTSNEEIIIGIIDTGVEYTHEDLRAEIWINQDEIPTNWQDSLDTNNDGHVRAPEIRSYLLNDGKDFNNDGLLNLQDALAANSPLMTGSDTDGNGYADDLMGWDFWQGGIPGQNRIQDNDPMGKYSTHGTHVAGLSGAATNNGVGISGTGYDAHVMPIKTGGIEDIPETPFNDTEIIGFGYEGMLYGALNGAEILNNSWGSGAFSEFERDIIETVYSTGALVVAASGNSGNNEVIYPARFDRTLAVGAVTINGSLTSYSNFGYELDVLATGTGILGPVVGNNYNRLSGTSMSTPIVSGLAALLRSLHPDWSADRIRQQIRVTSTRIDRDQNGNGKTSNLLEHQSYQLGHGFINAEQALSSNMPGLAIVSSRFEDANGNKLEVEEPGHLIFSVTNHGRSSSDFSFELVTPFDHLLISNPVKQGISIGHQDTLQFTFDIQIGDEYNLEKHPTFILKMQDPGTAYSDFHHFAYTDLLYDVMAANNVYTSFASDGTIGFTNPLKGTGGVGFQPRFKKSGQFKNGPNLLFEGGLITSFDGLVEDAVRSVNGEMSRDFKPLSIFEVTPSNKGAGIKGNAQFRVRSDTIFESNAHFTIKTYALENPAIDQTVYVKYTLTNTSFQNRQFRNVYVGLFNDWDIGNVQKNATGFVASDSLLYVYDESGEVPYYAGVMPMNKGVSSLLAINNAAQGGLEPIDFGLYDGFTDIEKNIALKAGVQRTEISNTDVSTVVATGPYHIGPKSKITIGFIYAYGSSLNELKSQIRSAQQRNLFATSATGLHLESDVTPDETKIYNNYPNPFNNTTNIRIDLSRRQQVTATVYNVIGRKVATLVDQSMSAGIHTLRFRGNNLSSGLYLVHVKTSQARRTVKVNLVK